MTENNNFYKINGYVTLEKVDSELPENKDQVTFDTNLKISNHSRNKLQTMASIGYSENQRSAVDVALQARYKKAARQKTDNKICEEIDLLSKNSPIGVVSNADNSVNHAGNTQSKKKKSKVNKTKTSAVNLPIQKVSEYYQQNIGVIKPLVLEDMRMYLNDFQEQNTSSDEAVKIIELAIKTAVDNNKLSWSYANACLKNWTNENLFTLKDIEAAREQRKADKQQANGFSKKPYVEQMTDWEHKQAKPVDPQKLAELQKQWEQFKTKQESS